MPERFCERASGLLEELGFQRHADAVDLAVHIVVAANQADALDLGALFEHLRRALDLQVLDQDDRVTIGQDGAVRVADHRICAIFVRYRGATGHGPFVGAVRADEVVTVLVCVFHGANGAGWGCRHVLAFCLDRRVRVNVLAF